MIKMNCDKKCKKSVFLSLYKFCYNSVHFCICQNLINSSVEIIIFIMSTELFAQISRVNQCVAFYAKPVLLPRVGRGRLPSYFAGKAGTHAIC